MEIKESYKERLSESGDNSRLIVMIRANWMTLEFSNALARPSARARAQVRRVGARAPRSLSSHFCPAKMALSCVRKNVRA